jgi:hypothetical protein
MNEYFGENGLIVQTLDKLYLGHEDTIHISEESYQKMLKSKDDKEELVKMVNDIIETDLKLVRCERLQQRRLKRRA